MVVCTLLLFQFLHSAAVQFIPSLKVHFIHPPQTRNGHTKKGTGSLIPLLGGTTAKWLQMGAALTFQYNTFFVHRWEKHPPPPAPAAFSMARTFPAATTPPPPFIGVKLHLPPPLLFCSPPPSNLWQVLYIDWRFIHYESTYFLPFFPVAMCVFRSLFVSHIPTQARLIAFLTETLFITDKLLSFHSIILFSPFSVGPHPILRSNFR